MSCKCISDIFRIAQTFYYPFSPIPMGFVSCDSPDLAGYRIQRWITKDNNVSQKNRVTRKNGLCSQLNAADKQDTMGPWKLLRHLVVILLLLLSFYRKGKGKIFFLQQHFPVQLEHGLSELQCLRSVFSLRRGAILISKP